MRNLDYFWPVDWQEEDFKYGVSSVLAFERKFARFFWGFTLITSIIFFYKAIYLKELNYVCWIPDRFFFSYDFVSFCQCFFMFLGLPLVTSFDILYMAFCFRLMIQFRMIARILNTINARNASKRKELVHCIQHHAFLIR